MVSLPVRPEDTPKCCTREEKKSKKVLDESKVVKNCFQSYGIVAVPMELLTTKTNNHYYWSSIVETNPVIVPDSAVFL